MISTPSTRPGVRRRTTAAILEAAASVFAERGGHASLDHVAAQAEVSRATLYRYFPTRQALLDELARVALDETSGRLSDANLQNAACSEGVARAVRALVTVGNHYIVLVREHVEPNRVEFERRLAAPVRELLEQGQAKGEIRADVPASWLTQALFGLVATGLGSGDQLGTEDTIAGVTSLFLSGASLRPVTDLDS
jgi:AcrR family transcriptional regulator